MLNNYEDGSEYRLGLTFSRTFSLVRPALSLVLQNAKRVREDGGKRLTNSDLKKNTNLGSIYIESMPRYGYGVGLLDHNHLPTLFGDYALIYDSWLEQVGTQWIMHYHLGAPHGPGPSFWNMLIINRFYRSSFFTREDIFEQIGEFVWKNTNSIPAKRSIDNPTTAFLGTYTKIDGLSKLRLLEITSSGRFHVQEPIPAPIWAVGYALLDYWQAQYPERISISLDTLHDSEFMKLFMLGKADLEAVLLALQEAKYIEFHRSVQPYQIVLLHQDSEPLLKRLYGAN